MYQYIVFSIVTIVGLLLIVLKQQLGASHAVYPYIDQIATTLLIGGGLGILHKAIVDRVNDERLRSLFKIHDSVERAGLREIRLDSSEFSYNSFLQDYDRFSFILNDGLRWIGNHAVKLKERLSRPGTQTDFFVTDPEGRFLPALAHKTGVPEGDLKKKIDDAVMRLKDLYEKSEKKGGLRIYFLKNFPTHSIFITEKILAVSPYQLSSGRTNPPIFYYERDSHSGCLHEIYSRDFENLRSESKLIWSSEKTV